MKDGSVPTIMTILVAVLGAVSLGTTTVICFLVKRFVMNLSKDIFKFACTL